MGYFEENWKIMADLQPEGTEYAMGQKEYAQDWYNQGVRDGNFCKQGYLVTIKEYEALISSLRGQIKDMHVEHRAKLTKYVVCSILAVLVTNGVLMWRIYVG